MTQAPLTREEMISIRKLIDAMYDEIHHPGSWNVNGGFDLAEMGEEVTDALQRLTHSIGPEAA